MDNANVIIPRPKKSGYEAKVNYEPRDETPTLTCIHCWHSAPVNNYSTWGTLLEEVCCHCGTRRNLHGPYAPSPYSGFQVQTRTLDG